MDVRRKLRVTSYKRQAQLVITTLIPLTAILAVLLLGTISRLRSDGINQPTQVRIIRGAQSPNRR